MLQLIHENAEKFNNTKLSLHESISTENTKGSLKRVRGMRYETHREKVLQPLISRKMNVAAARGQSARFRFNSSVLVVPRYTISLIAKTGYLVATGQQATKLLVYSSSSFCRRGRAHGPPRPPCRSYQLRPQRAMRV